MRYRHLAEATLLLVALTVLVNCGKPGETNVGSPDQASDSFVLPPLDIFPQGYGAPSDAVTLTFPPSDDKPLRTVYRIVNPDFNEQYAREMADKLGVKGEPRYVTTEDYSMYSFEDDSASLDVLDSGFTYHPKNESRPNAGEISDADALEKVKAFLTERDLLPDEAQFGAVSHWRDGTIDVTADNKFIPFLFVVMGNFPPFVISANLDPPGNLTDLTYQWPDIEPVGDYSLLSEREVHQEAILAEGEWATGAKATVTSFELSYDRASVNEDETYLVPVYCAMGDWSAPDNDEHTGCITPLPAIPIDKERRGDPDWARQRDEPWDSDY